MLRKGGYKPIEKYIAADAFTEDATRKMVAEASTSR